MYPQIFGKYVLERELARGGMARVVLATLRGAGGFEKRLVVKQIRDELSFDQQFVRRFVEEAKTTVALSHPNIVPVYELGVEQGTYFLAMELVEGCSIAELVREGTDDREGRVLTAEEGAYVGMEVCRALDYAHRRMKVVHRDITPRNVMVDEEGQVKLIDFGIAAPALVAGQEILGSPGHMPPEQVAGCELGPATDIFAVAVLLMEAWSGTAPFRQATPEECDVAMRKPHPKPSDYNARLLPLDDVIIRAMQLDPADRQQDASELGRALRAFLQGTDVADIARGLGDRVTTIRQAALKTAPNDAIATPRTSSTQDSSGTRTFATRAEAIHWSTTRSSDPDPEVASTRRLDSELNPRIPPPEAPRKVSKAARPDRNVDPAMSIPTPLLIEPAGDLSSLPRRSGRGQSDSTPPDERTNGSLTRDSEGLRPSLRPASKPLWTLGAVGVLVALGFFANWRSRSTRAQLARPPALTLRANWNGEASQVPPAAVVNASPVVSVSPEPALPASHPSGGVASSHAPARPSATASTTHKAILVLLGEPGTRVSIDGAPAQMVPVSRANIEPGTHDVKFQFDPTRESHTERFSVKPGERVTLRAEFTGATPLVRVQRQDER